MGYPMGIFNLYIHKQELTKFIYHIILLKVATKYNAKGDYAEGAMIRSRLHASRRKNNSGGYHEKQIDRYSKDPERQLARERRLAVGVTGNTRKFLRGSSNEAEINAYQDAKDELAYRGAMNERALAKYGRKAESIYHKNR